MDSCSFADVKLQIYIFHLLWLISLLSYGQSIDELSTSYLEAHPDEALSIIDSLLQESIKSNDLAAELKLLKKRKKISKWTYQTENVILDLNRSIYLSKHLGLEANLADLFQSKATYTARLGKMEEALVLLDSTQYYLKYAPGSEELDVLIQVNYLKGRIYDRAGSLEKAITHYLKTIEDAEKINRTSKIMDVYFNMGFVNRALDNLDKAIENYKQSLDYSIELKDTTYMIYNHVFIAGALLLQLEKLPPDLRQKNLEKASLKLQEATVLASDRDDPYELELLYFELSNYHNALGDYDQAIDYIYKSRLQSQKAQNLETEMATYVQAATFYNKSKEYKKSIREAQLGVVLAKKIGAYYYLSDLYKELAIAEENQQNIAASYDFYKKYITVKDSVFKQESANKVNELQTRFETEKKEAEIASLSQQSAIQKLQLRQRTQTIYFTILAFLLIISIVVIFYFQRNASRKRKQIELEQRFLRSQLNPHFISNALITVQASLYEQDSEGALAYLETFSRLMREMLENSREEFISVADELSMVKDYLEINQKRMNDAFVYKVEVDESIEPEMEHIPPMFIQPFVENAIEHGIFPDKKGMIIVKLSKKNEDTIELVIEDNGQGIQQAETNIKKKRSLSTSIIEERIALYNQSLNNKIKLLIENKQGENGKIAGTRVALQVPSR